MEWSLVQLIIQVVAFPFQLINFVVTTIMDLLVFDVLQLGPWLPL